MFIFRVLITLTRYKTKISYVNEIMFSSCISPSKWVIMDVLHFPLLRKEEDEEEDLCFLGVCYI